MESLEDQESSLVKIIVLQWETDVLGLQQEKDKLTRVT